MRAMIAKRAQAFRKRRIPGRDHAAVADSGEILGGIEAETARDAKRSRGAALTSCQNSLSGVFHNGELVFRRDCREAAHLRALAVEMHGDDRFDAARVFLTRKNLLDRGRADIKRPRI